MSFRTPEKSKTQRRFCGSQGCVDVFDFHVVKTYDWKHSTNGYGSAREDHENAVLEHTCLHMLSDLDGVVNLSCDLRVGTGTKCPTEDEEGTTLYMERLLPVGKYLWTSEQFQEKMRATLHAVHAAGIAHTDLNASNVMCRKEEPVLIDFGKAAFQSKLSKLKWEEAVRSDHEELSESIQFERRKIRRRVKYV